MATQGASGYTPAQVTQASSALPRWLGNETLKIATSITSLLQVLQGQLPLSTYTVATLPAGVSAGVLANVSDGAASLSWGATVTGGGTVSYLVRFNGTNWTVVGK